MNGALVLTGVVITICILLKRVADKLAVPSLLLFIFLGMCFGVDGLFRIPFDEYGAVETICSVCLIFIMFYGGFGTNVSEARPVVVRSVLLSTVGVVITAGLVGLFARFAFGLGWLESFLIGSVISSTDAASTFNILRYKRLGLKYNTASLLEIESGSNDPMSYMLTILFVSLMSGKKVNVPLMIFKQFFFGILFGVLFGVLMSWILTKFSKRFNQTRTILVFATAILAYAVPSVCGGNGYLGVYICGIIMGNCHIPKKRDLVQFFDVITDAAQMMIFFLLGLLVTPSKLPLVFIPALLITLFLTFVARPISVLGILAPFKLSMNQVGIVSWAGLRGVASIVFSIFAILRNIPMKYNLFDLVFCIVLLSITFQGGLLPFMSKRMKMIDPNSDVNKTFNDYQAENNISFVKINVTENHPWSHKVLRDIQLPSQLLIVLIMRNNSNIIPNGNTEILPGDLIVMAGKEFEDRQSLTLSEEYVDKNHKFKDKPLKDVFLEKSVLVVMIMRDGDAIIPRGHTVIKEDDTLVIARF